MLKSAAVGILFGLLLPVSSGGDLVLGANSSRWFVVVITPVLLLQQRLANPITRGYNILFFAILVFPHAQRLCSLDVESIVVTRAALGWSFFVR